MNIDFLGGKVDLLILRGKWIRLFLAPKWCLACGGQIRVFRTQLLDLVVEQSAQISYRILQLRMGFFDPVNNLIFNRNLCLILLSKI